MILVGIVYILVGCGGYLAFPGRVDGNILNNFSSSDKLVSIGRICLSITIFCALPLLVHPCRGIFDLQFFSNAYD
jgi:solute carrier family 38 (sodium-coupled neutral amino acid transporter), member 11